MKYRMLLLIAASITLFGCSQSALESTDFTGEFTQYQCDSAKAFQVGYMPSQNKALLLLSETRYRLIQVPSGSGTKYILDDGPAEKINPVTLFTKGADARLELGRVIYKNCQIVD